MEEQGEKQEFNYDLMLVVINFAKAAKQLLKIVDVEKLDNLEECVLQAKVNGMVTRGENIDMVKKEDFSKNFT